MARRFSFWIVLILLASCGCSDKPPTVYPVSGKVTYSGKPYARLLIYFRPASGEVDKFGSNHGVGETDAEGKFTVKSAAGGGLQSGSYKVTFALYQDVRSGKPVGGGSEKPDESGIATKQVVAAPHDDETSQATTPVTFTVRSGDNTFDFDIPKGK